MTFATSILIPEPGEQERALAISACLYVIPLLYSIWYAVRALGAMRQPGEAPAPPPPLSRWCTWWFTPRWRALLTWLVLLGSCVEFSDHFGGLAAAPYYAFELLRRKFDVQWLWPLVFYVREALQAATFLWFEPLALRLNFKRGIIWIAFRVAPQLWFLLREQLFHVSERTTTMLVIDTLIAGAILIPVLYRWRTRPWMCLIGVVLSEAVFLSFTQQLLSLPSWLFYDILILPVAIPLLYGTRLLTPEERAQRQG